LKFDTPNMARIADALHLAQRADGLGERDLRVRPMDQQQIDLGEPHARQALLGGALEVVRRQMDCHTLVVTHNILALTPDACRPSPTSRSLSYISAVSIWR